jgi:uncharacterized cupredoxin-like copper-binding protein
VRTQDTVCRRRSTRATARRCASSCATTARDPHELAIGTVAEMMEQQKKGGHAGHSMADMARAGGVWVESGKTATFVWTFKRTANLELARNIPNHYDDGMKGSSRSASRLTGSKSMPRWASARPAW